MTIRWSALLPLGVLQLLATCAVPAPGRSAGAARVEESAPGPRIVGYFPAWAPGSKGVSVSAVPAAQLTHLNYAFALVAPDGTAMLGDPCADVGQCDPKVSTLPSGPPAGSFAELLRLKQRHPHLRTLISVGGWNGSERFSDVALTAESRRRFAESTVQLFLRRWPGVFDGIDLDWEYPVLGGRPENRYRPEDRQNLTLLLRELRRRLDEQGARDRKRYLLTIAAPAGESFAEQFDVAAIVPLLDWVNLMTYDFHTGGSIAHFNAPLYPATADPTPRASVHGAVERWLQAGVPPRKLVVGVPFYGYGYAGVPAASRGLYQRAAGGKPGEWGVGAVDYRDLRRREPERNGFERHWDPSAQVPWLFNPRTGAWIGYDDAESLALKADYVRERGLGGVMIWELSADDGTLLPAVHSRLNR